MVVRLLAFTVPLLGYLVEWHSCFIALIDPFCCPFTVHKCLKLGTIITCAYCIHIRHLCGMSLKAQCIVINYQEMLQITSHVIPLITCTSHVAISFHQTGIVLQL